jgi:hypothetical protein
MPVVLGVFFAVEAYYWFWWLPRNWQKNRECLDFHYFLTGKLK